MKILTFLILLFIPFYPANAQQVINGGFENWDTTRCKFPLNWKAACHLCVWNAYCWQPRVSVVPTNDAYSGNLAARLEAGGGCAIGFLAYGYINPKWLWGLPSNERPETFNFYYKYKSVGGDTALASLILRDTTNTGAEGRIIGEAKFSIIKDTSAYVHVSVPVIYFSTDTPVIMQIVFVNSKSLFEQLAICAPLMDSLALGTTLWIDDVSVSGGSLGIAESSVSTLSVYPNPFNDHFIISSPAYMQDKIVARLFNSEGKEVKVYHLTKYKETEFIINVPDIRKGLYCLEITDDKNKFRKIIMKY